MLAVITRDVEFSLGSINYMQNEWILTKPSQTVIIRLSCKYILRCKNTALKPKESNSQGPEEEYLPFLTVTGKSLNI